MTEDKEIIIDGVDVSGCSYFFGEDLEVNVCMCSRCGNTQNFYCKDNPNCYNKQLKRSEHECEELKKKLQTATKALEMAYKDFSIEFGTPQYEALEQALEKIGGKDER